MKEKRLPDGSLFFSWPDKKAAVTSTMNRSLFISFYRSG
jgi:hypothetical protein